MIAFSRLRRRCCDCLWGANRGLTRRARQKTLEQLLSAGLAADWLIEAAQRLRRKIRATHKTAVIDSDEEPVVGFSANVGATRAGTLDGGNDVWVAE
jgi:hypothetical protein